MTSRHFDLRSSPIIEIWVEGGRFTNMKKTIYIIALFVWFPSIAVAATPEKVYQRASRSVVVVHTKDALHQPLAQGSGVAIASGEVVTNCHVLKSGASFEIQVGTSAFPATIVAADWDADLCILNVPGLKIPPAQIGSSGNLSVGSRVYAVGSPRGLDLSLSEGIVSQLRKETSHPLIQTTAPISSGSSGGGLFDDEGSLVGITTYYVEGGQNLNFAVPIEWVALINRSASVVSQPHVERTPETVLLIKAFEYGKKEQFVELLEFATEWSERDPSNKWGWYFKGFAYFAIGSDSDEPIKSAIREYKNSLAVDPQFAWAWSSLGYAYDLLDRALEAENAFRRALEIDSSMDELWASLGDVNMDLRRPQEAASAYRLAVKTDPSDQDSWRSLGSALFLSGNKFEALEAFRRAVALDPTDAWSYGGLGVAQSAIGRNFDAAQSFRKAVELNPSDASTLYMLGTAYADIHDFQKAKAVNKRLKGLDFEKWLKLGKYIDLSEVTEAYRQSMP